MIRIAVGIMPHATRQVFVRSAGALIGLAGATAGATPVSLRVGDVGRTLLACWAPPAAGGAVTLALSFRRDGTVIGVPRITSLQPGQTSKADRAAGNDRAELAASIAAAVRQCTPVRLSPALQQVLPGQILRIRFTAAPDGTSKGVSTIWSGT